MTMFNESSSRSPQDVIARAKQLLSQLADRGWQCGQSGNCNVVAWAGDDVYPIASVYGKGNQEFIAASPQLIRDLVAALEAQHETVKRLNRRCQIAEAAANLKVEEWDKRSKRAGRAYVFQLGLDAGRAEARASEGVRGMRSDEPALMIRGHGDIAQVVEALRAVGYRVDPEARASSEDGR